MYTKFDIDEFESYIPIQSNFYYTRGKKANILPEELEAFLPHLGLNSHAVYKILKNCTKYMQHASLRR
jgi:hypothetical protein